MSNITISYQKKIGTVQKQILKVSINYLNVQLLHDELMIASCTLRYWE
jgi:hypothetical protein